MSKFTEIEFRLISIVLILLFLGGITLYGSQKKSIELRQQFQDEQKDIIALNYFFSTTDNAKAVYVYDATKDKVFYERNADEILPLASLSKLATAITALDNIGAESKINISAKSLEKSGDNGLNLAEIWRLDKLVSFMLVVSSNDAAFAIKEKYEESGKDFMQDINNKAKEIGLLHSSFYNPAGLDSLGQPGAVGTAKDVSALLIYFLKHIPEIAEQTTLPEGTFNDIDGRAHTVSNTNDLSTKIDSLLISKTGFTSLAGGNLAIAYRMPIYGDTIVIVVLGSTREGRFVDIEHYMEGVDNYFRISNK